MGWKTNVAALVVFLSGCAQHETATTGTAEWITDALTGTWVQGSESQTFFFADDGSLLRSVEGSASIDGRGMWLADEHVLTTVTTRSGREVGAVTSEEQQATYYLEQNYLYMGTVIRRLEHVGPGLDGRWVGQDYQAHEQTRGASVRRLESNTSWILTIAGDQFTLETLVNLTDREDGRNLADENAEGSASGLVFLEEDRVYLLVDNTSGRTLFESSDEPTFFGFVAGVQDSILMTPLHNRTHGALERLE